MSDDSIRDLGTGQTRTNPLGVPERIESAFI